MSSKAFMFLVAAIVVIAGAGGGAYAMFAGKSNSPQTINASSTNGATNQSTTSNNTTTSNDSNQTTTGTGQNSRGNFRLNAEPISGTVVSATATTLTLMSNGAPVDITVPADTPVTLASTVATATDDLTPGTQLIALLQRQTDGSITATSLVVGNTGRGAGGGFGGRFGRNGGGAGGTGSTGGTGGTGGSAGATPTPDTSGFNAVQGTIVSLANGVLTLSTSSGNVAVTVTDATPVRLSLAYSDALSKLNVGDEFTVLGQHDETGTYTPFAITSGALRLGNAGGTAPQGGTGQGGPGGRGFFFRNGGGAGGFPPPGGFDGNGGFVPPQGGSTGP